MNRLTPSQFKVKCEDSKFNSIHPFIHELLKMDSRICLSPLFGDVDEDKGFFITKKAIHIPYELPSIQHDIAHLLELTECKRWVMADWGMPTFYFGAKIAPRHIFSGLSREVRVRAIQLHLTQFNSEDKKLHSSAHNILNNFYWEELVKSSLPFGRFKKFKDVDTWVCDLRDRTYNRWSLDRIQHEWKVRLSYIQNWMETTNE